MQFSIHNAHLLSSVKYSPTLHDVQVEAIPAQVLQLGLQIEHILFSIK